MLNTLIRISYDGTAYSGFQIQDNALTIQGELERALAVIYKQPIRITGAGRTDAGVHASGQTANFTAPFSIEGQRLPYALKALLPPDIVVYHSETVNADFHARFSARRKRYSYSIDRAPFPQVKQRLYQWHQPDPLNMPLIERAVAMLKGSHDFKAFQASGSAVQNTVRTIFQAVVKETGQAEQLRFILEGDGFLYKMVRILVGTLIRVGQENLTIKDFEAVLAGQVHAHVGPTAPAHGLCLEEVIY